MPYETKPMKKQWLEVDGRLTPIILPQIWNHELQDWVVTSEQNPLPTQVIGSNVEVIKKHEDTFMVDTPVSGTRWMYFGSNEINSPTALRALDVSEFSDVSIYLENNYNDTLTSIIVYGFKEKNSSGRDGNLLYQFNVGALEEGESIYITKEEFEDLKKPITGLGLRYAGNSDEITEGSSQIIFYGKRRG